MNRFKYLAFALLLGTGSAWAAHPGYVDLDAISAHTDASPSFSVTLGDWILNPGERAVEEEPELAALRGLESLQVRVYEEADLALVDGMASFAHELGASGWQRVVTVSDGDTERVRLLMKPDGDHIAGLTVLVYGGDREAVLVNAYGDISPEDMGRLIAGIGEVGDVDLASARKAAER